MSISHQATGTAGDSATSASVGFPTGIQAGDLLLLCAVAKYSAYTSAPPTDFIFLEELVGGSGGTGIDAGDVRTAVWYKIATGSESGSVNVTKATQTGSVIYAYMLLYRRTAGYGWSLLSTDGVSSSGSTAWSAAGANSLALEAGDMVVCVSGVNTNPVTFSSQSISASGATFSAAAELVDAGTNTGHDIALFITEHAVASGSSTTAPTYTATGSTGTPDGTTIFVRLRESRGIAADQGDYDLTGQDAGLLKHTIMSAEQGSYALTGQDVDFPAGEPRAWAPGVWAANAWYGTSWYGQGAPDFPITAEYGSYALSGQDVTFKAERLLAADYDSYALTGQDAGLAKGYKLTAEQGGYTLTPQEFASSRTYAITAEYGSYTQTSIDVVFPLGATVGRAWVTDAWYSGAWYGTVWADNAGAPNHYLMVADVGSYAIGPATQTAAWLDGAWSDDAWSGTAWQGGAGSQTGLLVGYRLDAESGSYVYTGDDALRDILMVPESGSYALNGQDNSLYRGKSLTAEAGSYALTGVAAGGLRGYRMTAQFGGYSTSGSDVEFIGGIGEFADPGYYTLTGQDATFSVTRLMTAEQGSYALNGQDARFVQGGTIDAFTGTYTLTGQDVTFTRAYRLTADTGYYALGGQLQPVVTPTKRQGGGTKKRRKYEKRYVVEIDGQEFVVETEEEAADLLAQAKAVAVEMLEDVKTLKTQTPKIPKIRVKGESGEGFPELVSLVAEKRAEIKELYDEARDQEIAAHLRKLQEDDEEDAITALLIN